MFCVQVVSYGAKLRYTISYVASSRGTHLDDADVQIIVSQVSSPRLLWSLPLPLNPTHEKTLFTDVLSWRSPRATTSPWWPASPGRGGSREPASPNALRLSSERWVGAAHHRERENVCGHDSWARTQGGSCVIKELYLCLCCSSCNAFWFLSHVMYNEMIRYDGNHTLHQIGTDNEAFITTRSVTNLSGSACVFIYYINMYKQYMFTYYVTVRQGCESREIYIKLTSYTVHFRCMSRCCWGWLISKYSVCICLWTIYMISQNWIGHRQPGHSLT